MKKVLIGILTFICAFNVQAISLKENETYIHVPGRSDHTDRTVFVINGDHDYDYVNSVHYIKSGDDIAPLFCLDPMQYAPSSQSTHNNELSISRLLYGGIEKARIAEDYAFSTILSSSTDTGLLDSESDIVEYGAVSLALRLFNNGVIQKANTDKRSYTPNGFVRYINTLKNWIDNDKELASLFNTACTHAKSKDSKVECDLGKYISNLKDKIGVNPDTYFISTRINGQSAESQSYSKGKEYLKNGLKAYNKAFEETLVQPKAIVQEAYTFKGTHSSTVVVSVDFNNFGTNYDTSYFKITKVSEANSNARLIGYKVGDSPENASDYTAANQNANFYQLAGDNKRIYLLFQIDTNIKEETEENCNVTLNIEYEYDDPFLYSGAYVRAYTAIGDLADQFQRFIAFTKGYSNSLKVSLQQCETICQPQNTFPELCSSSSTVVKGKVVSTFKEGYDDTGKLNINKCVTGNTDANGNPYMVEEYRENPYCNVFCKEDLEIKTPYKIETYSGRSIDLSVEITGTQSCYSSKIDYDRYRADLAGATDEEKQVIQNNMDACMNVNVKYSLEPRIKYTYQEEVHPTDYMVLKSIKVNPTETRYCQDEDFERCSAAKNNQSPYTMSQTTISSTYTTPRIYYIGSAQLGLIKINVSDKEKESYYLVPGLPISPSTETGTYEYKIELDNIGTYYNLSNNKKGRIFGGENSLAAIREDNNKTPKDNYKCTYSVNTSDDGNYCIDENEEIHPRSECTSGEDWDKCKQRICPRTPEVERCIKEKGVFYKCTSDHYTENACIKYGNTNEDRLRLLKDINCATDGKTECKRNINCCPQCEITIIPECPACIITNSGSAIDYRTISNTNVNPNNKQMGYNWNINNTPAGIKALYTITEIENSEGKKFDDVPISGEDDNSNVGGLSNNYSLRVVMTPDMASFIKEYNRTNKDSGSYVNDSLSCTDYEVSIGTEAACESSGYTWDNGKCVIDNLFCYSNFIDQLIEKYPDDVKAPQRNEARNNGFGSFVEYKIDGIDNPQAKVQTNGYWTIFPDFILDNAGPSWK